MSTTKTLPTDSSWEVHLPVSRGSLPGGTPLRRTEPSGAVGAAIVLLGAYPAATRTRQTKVGDVRLTLPVEVEVESFAAGSRSGFELERHYLVPLALPRARTLLTDLWPYYLSNTTKSTSGRSMADNIALHERHTGERLGIEARPEPSELVARAHREPGNRARIAACLSGARLVLTLGAEAAAFVREEPFDVVRRDVDRLFYADAAEREVLGRAVRVVHLVHPHLFIKRNERWMRRHEGWVHEVGRRLIEHTLASIDERTDQ